MFSIFGRSGKLCDTASRRELLTVGGLSLFGLSLPNWLRQRSFANDGQHTVNGFGRADSVILV